MRLAWIVCGVALLSACGTPRPPAQLLHLAWTPPAAAAATASNSPGYQLMHPVRLPDYLDRDAIIVPQGAPGTSSAALLAPIEGYRWAEPLREAVPRLLRADLAALLGSGRLWSAPLPPGVAPQRQWRVEIVSLEANAARTAVVLRASWTLADAAATGAARAQTIVIEAPSADSSAPALALAHRAAVLRLAEAMVAASGR